MSTSQGQVAERYAADYLANIGFTILSQNWKNKFCEIDIVAERAGRVHFVEVKYRTSSYAGGGVDYITLRKLKQMEFAARSWMAEHKPDHDCQLDVIAIDGEIKLQNLSYIPNVTG